jgi:hypothetical protein
VHWLTPEQNARVVKQLAAQREAQEQAGAGHNFRAAFVNKDLWLLIYVNFALLCGTYGVSFWLPQIVQGLGVKSPAQTPGCTGCRASAVRGCGPNGG